MLTMNSVKILHALHAVRSAMTATAELHVYFGVQIRRSKHISHFSLSVSPHITSHPFYPLFCPVSIQLTSVGAV